MSIETLAIIISGAVQLIALLITVGKILSSSAQQYTTAEVRNAERFMRLETKTDRLEKDVQSILNSAPGG